jgi:GT2 family glycosyltransferase/glycosyltransferase involved in cell wall biosynthesis
MLNDVREDFESASFYFGPLLQSAFVEQERLEGAKKSTARRIRDLQGRLGEALSHAALHDHELSASRSELVEFRAELAALAALAASSEREVESVNQQAAAHKEEADAASRLAASHKEEAEAARRLAASHKEEAEAARRLAASHKEEAEAARQLAVFHKEEVEAAHRLAALRKEEADAARRLAASRKEEVEASKKFVAARENEVLSLRRQVAARDARAGEALARVQEMKRSTSWKVTRPLRGLQDFARRCRRKLKRALRKKTGKEKKHAAAANPAKHSMARAPIEQTTRAHPAGTKITTDPALVPPKLADVPIERAIRSDLEMSPGPPEGVPRPAVPQLHNRPVTIVVPVFNAYKEVRRCLDHLRRFTPARHRIIVIDDASTDAEIGPLLDWYAAAFDFNIVRHETNRGYTRTINEGLEYAGDSDVILLNSDTAVSRHWVRHLQEAVFAALDIATATAVSDNAGAFSVPEMGEANDLPPWLAAEDIGPIIGRLPWSRYPLTPTGSGFCLYIRRDAIAVVGSFDANAFPRGYGEENDFCLRALRHGMRHVVCLPAYVTHARNASFGAEKDRLLKEGRALIDQRYPEYGKLVRGFTGAEAPLRAAGPPIRQAIAMAARRPRPRIMFVVSTVGGGTPRTNFDLMDGLSWRYETLLMQCNRSTLTLYHYSDRKLFSLEERQLTPPVSLPNHDSQAYGEAVCYLLSRYDVSLIHIRHISWHGLSLTAICKSMDIPIVFSFHDYYMLCPSIQLLDQKFQFHEPGEKEEHPRRSPLWPANKLAESQSGRGEWRRMMARALEPCSTFVTTSEDAKARLLRGMPSLAGKPFEVIEHGRDFPEPLNLRAAPEHRLRVIVLGGYSVHKGANLIETVLRMDREGLVEFHVFGRKDTKPKHPRLITHADYHRKELARLTRRINPHIAAVLSIWPETYSHTLSESWAMGLPVLATDLGAVGERVRAHSGGWLVEPSPEGILKQLERLAASPDEITARADEVANWQRTHCAEPEISRMAEAYNRIYRTLLQPRPARRARANSLPSRLRVGLFLKELRAGVLYATSHVRLLAWLQHPRIAPAVEVNRLFWHSADRAQLAKCDIVIAQRDALRADEAFSVVARCKDLSIPFLYELDDHLLDVPASIDPTGLYTGAREAIELQLRSADVILTPTPTLAKELSAYNANVVVHANAIDEFHLLSRAGPSRKAISEASDSMTIDCLFMGTRGHAEDLAFVDSALEEALRLEPRLRFTTIGCPPPSPRWRSLEVPRNLDYPAFGSWFRAQAHQFTFAVAPLLDTTFNRRKSGLKFLEYASVGLPGLFSSLNPFQDIVEHQRTGLLVENAGAAWVEAVVKMAQDTGLRSRIAHESHAEVIKHHLICDNAGRFLELLCRLANAGGMRRRQAAQVGTLSE